MNLKKFLLGTIACTMVLGICTGNALAADKKAKKSNTGLQEPAVYVALRGGLDMMRHNGHKDTWLGAGAIGVRYWEMRAELEYTYHGEVKKSRDGFDTKLKSQSYLANLYFDIPVSMHIQPFVSAGAGVSRVRLTEETGKKSKNKFSWTVGGGVSYDITKNWALDVGYRFLDLGASVRSNEIYGGVRFAF